MKGMMAFLLAALCPLALAATAEAVSVTVNGSSQFDSGGFESDTVGNNPSTAAPGGWILDEMIGLSTADVNVLGPASTGPGAADGDKYMALYKDAGVSLGDMCAMAVLANPALTGDSVVANFSVYVDSADNTRISEEGCHVVIDFLKEVLPPGNNFGSRHTWLAFNFPEGAVPDLVSSEGWQERQLYVTAYVADLGGWGNVTTGGGATNMFVEPDTWLNMQLNLTVGSHYTVTIDGVQSDPVAVEGSLAMDPVYALQFFDNCSSQDGLFYVDGSAGGPPPIPGDANHDGKVTDADAAILATNWQSSSATWGMGDFNGDGHVTDADAAILATHWQEGTEGAAPVPEPSTLALLAGVVGLLLLRRRS